MCKTIIYTVIITSLYILSCQSREGYIKKNECAFPVSEKYTLFLGPPKCLGKIMEKGQTHIFETASCGTTNPTSYVTTTGNEIYQNVNGAKGELGNNDEKVNMV